MQTITKPLAMFAIFVGNIIYDLFSEIMSWPVARTNMWPEVCHEKGVRRLTKLFLGTTTFALLMLSIHTYHFGPWGPTGQTSQIFGLVITDFSFNNLNRWFVPIEATVVVLWAGYIYAVSRRLKTKAYRRIKANSKFNT